ncbi:MAG: glutamate--tRNA ligase [Candidatus Eisenbacteria bacterium]|nr:glutamate--tRNA ligase [Candidatus Eisenbacteria bacterium]
MNWLLARHNDGVFVLRIEDTDRERSTAEFADAILEDLSWLGLDWDEGPRVGGAYGPYFQSERGGSYQPMLERLLESGAAYRCYCTPDELDERRSSAPAGGRDWRYDRRCLHLDDTEKKRLEDAGRPFVVRFRVPDGKTVIDDMVQGRVEVDNSELDDLVLARSDGTPTYNFVVVVDDLSMEITHVIRGSDHLSNTPKQILLARALGGAPPTFGHLPLVLGPDGKVLSKRRGALAIGEYRRAGFVREALVNYLALLGWSPGDDRELLSPDELVAEFDVGRVSRKPAALDPDKLEWMNEQWLVRLGPAERAHRIIPRLREAGYLTSSVDDALRERIERIVELLGDRVKTLDDAADQMGFFLASSVSYDNIDVLKVLAKPGAGKLLAGLHDVLESAPSFDADDLEPMIRDFAQSEGVGLGKVAQPLRAAVSGRTATPGIFETLSLLGRDTVLERITEAMKHTKD